MPAFSSPLTVDQDVFTWEPTLTGSTAISGIIDHLHIAASDEVARDIQVRWWNTQERTGDFDADKLDRDQLYRLAVYRLLGFHVWPKLDSHNEENTFPLKRAEKWRSDYSVEFDNIMAAGILYQNDAGEYVVSDKAPAARRSIPLVRG